MIVPNLCNEVLENAIRSHETCEKAGLKIAPLDAVAVQAMKELLQYRAIGTVEEFQTRAADKWISVTDRLPDDGDCRFYMCLVENHIEDVPMICQFEEEVGFGFYKDIYDPVSLGFVDTEFETMEEIGYEKVMYWRQIPEPPKDWSDEE